MKTCADNGKRYKHHLPQLQVLWTPLCMMNAWMPETVRLIPSPVFVLLIQGLPVMSSLVVRAGSNSQQCGSVSTHLMEKT